MFNKEKKNYIYIYIVQTEVERKAVETAENWESYHKQRAVIGDFAPSSL